MAATGVVLASPFGHALAQSNELSCVVQESGTLWDWPLVVAAVITDQAAACDAKIEALRDEIGYHTPIKFGKGDDKSTEFGSALIQLFADDESLQLRAQVLTNDPATWPDDPTQIDQRYFARYRSILETPIADFSDARVRVPRLGNPTRVNGLVMFVENLPNHPEVAQEEGPPSNLGQLARYFAAGIRAEQKGTERQMLDELKAALGVSSLAGIDTDKTVIRIVSI
jgi:hypothetical protein